MRRIRLSFPASGESVIAGLLDDEAPGVCDFIWSRLPIEETALHGMYSGAEIFSLIPDPAPAPEENLVQLPLPGELLYFYDPGRGATGARKPAGEICFVYSRGVVLRAHEGVPTHASLFARVPGDWKTDWTAFAQACRRCRWEGPRILRVERVEES
ncbi:MAG: DUF3830 family protein [Acidobacteria bacterium]|nr:DUF3830 family protein [Acidobacteriota bacterium]